MATRIVSVEFNEGISDLEIAEFSSWLHHLASRTSGLVRMTCGPHFPALGENELSSNAPNAVFCHFASVWEFDNTTALNNFVIEPFHREMAGKDFRRFVKRRFVTNIG